MSSRISKRLLTLIDALPLKKGLRVVEIGCGTGVMAREIVSRIGNGSLLAIDRSEKAIDQCIRNSKDEIASGRLKFQKCAVENFTLPKNEKPFDMAIAVRVGALDGRHPEIEQAALINLSKALISGGKLYIDGGDPWKEIDLSPYQ